MSAQLTFTISSVPDRDDLVAELWFGDDMFAELRTENGTMMAAFYAPPHHRAWEFPVQEFQQVLQAAASRLASGA